MKSHSSEADADVVVAGAGIIGLIAALQFAKRGLKVVLIDDVKVRKPTYKVGESTLVFTAGFVRTIGELDDYLNTTCQPKIGVAFMEGMEGKPASEMKNQSTWALMHTIPQRWVDAFVSKKFFRAQLKDVQLVRHEVEALMADKARANPNITFIDTARVKDFEIHEDGTPHLVRWQAGTTGESGEVKTRWVIDCAGRVRKLAKLRGHVAEEREMNDGFQTTAIWGQFSGIRDDMFNQDWALPKDEGVEYDEKADFTTLHLWGDGYWIWVIRLDTGRISIGVTFAQNKPLPGKTPKEQLWGVLRRYPIFDNMLFEENLLEFKMYKNVQYMTDTFVSEHRYGMMGDSASIIDAYYSQGMSLAMAKSWHAANVIEDDIRRNHLDRAYIQHINRHGRADWHMMRNTIKEKYTSAIADGRFFILSHWIDMCMVIGLGVPRYQLNRWLTETDGYSDREQEVHKRMRENLKKNLFFTRSFPWRFLPPEKIHRLQAYLQKTIRERAMWRIEHGCPTPKMRSIIRPAATAPQIVKLMFPGKREYVDISPASLLNEPQWMRVTGTEEAPVLMKVAGMLTFALFWLMYGADGLSTAWLKLKAKLGLLPAPKKTEGEGVKADAAKASSEQEREAA